MAGERSFLPANLVRGIGRRRLARTRRACGLGHLNPGDSWTKGSVKGGKATRAVGVNSSKL